MSSYVSTRDSDIRVNASEAILKGLSDEGGLFMLDEIPSLPLEAMIGMDFQSTAKVILKAMLSDFTQDEIDACVEQAYTNKFETDECTPIVSVGDRYVLELFHGPTSAFKDVALSILPRLMSLAKKKNKTQEEIIILTATSGDTGSAALNGFSDVDGIRIIVFFPDQGISATQRAQMVTCNGKNVSVCAVKGNFDDAQSGVKTIFTSPETKKLSESRKLLFSSANSINIGRLIPQMVYYFKSYANLVNKGDILPGEPVNFAVPTGNFGNILAGYMAKLSGLPIAKLICASNSNNVLTEFLHSGVYDMRRNFLRTLSPSMDILLSSNLERMLYLSTDRNPTTINRYMNELYHHGYYQVDDSIKNKIDETFYSGFCSDTETLETIGNVYRDEDYLMDPHTAVAWKVSEDFKNAQINFHKTIVLATASPYKFAHSVLIALNQDGSGDEFSIIRRLHKLTGSPIPKNLIDLENMEVRHNSVIEKEDMAHYVFTKVGEQTW